MGKLYYLWVLGCQMNQADAKGIEKILADFGWQKTVQENQADLVVVVACSVRQAGINSIIGKAREWRSRRQTGELKALLTGCVLSSDQKELSTLFDEIIPPGDFTRLKATIATLASGDRLSGGAGLPQPTSFRALIPISNGCNNFCSYCVVPYTRGPERCRPAASIIAECRQAADAGIKEIVLIGQNVNSYFDAVSGVDFPQLLKTVDSLAGDYWLRFISSHPKDFSDQLLAVMAGGKHIVPQLHLALQAGDNEILRQMNRHYTAEQFLALVEKARCQIPGLALSTDIIVGFPGETKEQFLKTAALMEKLALDLAYIAPYSKRVGTAAASFFDNVPLSEKKQRAFELNEILKKTALESNRQYLGRTVRVLVDGYKGGRCWGRTMTNKAVGFAGPRELFGEFTEVKITSAKPFSLAGERVC